MNETTKKIYFYLTWYKTAYHYTPSQAQIAEACKCSPTRVIVLLKELAKAGYIELFLLPCGAIDVNIKIDPTRPWVANMRFSPKGVPILTSEIPLKLYIWGRDKAEPVVVLSEKDLIKEQLKKSGVRV